MATPAPVSRIRELRTVSMDLIDPLRFGNPHVMSDRMRGHLRASIGEFGIVEPIVAREVSGRYEILNGHHRFAELKETGAVEIDVVVVEADDKKARAIALALNRITADWDYDALSRYVDDALKDGAQADWLASVTGFGNDEIGVLTAQLASSSAALAASDSALEGSGENLDALAASAEQAVAAQQPLATITMFTSAADAELVLEHFRLKAKVGAGTHLKNGAIDGTALAAFLQLNLPGPT